MTSRGELRVWQREVGAMTLVAVGVLLLIIEPWRGPVVIVFSSNQGLDLGNLLTLGLLVAAGMLVYKSPVVAPSTSLLRRCRRSRWFDCRQAAIGAGTMLLAVGTSELGDGGGAHRRAIEAVIAFVVLASIGWFVAAAGRSVAGPAVALGCGVLLDALVLPSGTLFGPIFAAGYLVVRARRRGSSSVALSIAIALFAAASIASLADIAGLDVRMADGGGGPARTAALGLVLVLAGAPSTRPAPATAEHGPPD